MKNKYKIIDDMAIIYLEQRDGTILNCKVDRADLKELSNFNFKWHAFWNEPTKSYYTKATEYLGLNKKGKPTYRTVYMHKFLMKSPDGRNVAVNHKNHDTLDNRQ